MYKGKLAVGLISYNRPHYFVQLLKSLENQTYLENTDFHLFQDGGRTIADKINIAENVKLFDYVNLENKKKHIRHKNVSIGINQFEAVEYLTNKYEYIIMIEDDVILSTNYLKLIRVLINQVFESNEYKDVFGVSLNFLRRCNKRDINKNKNKVIYKNEHWWAECFSTKNWKIVKPYFLNYYKLIKNVDYNRRPHHRIKALFKNAGLNIPQTSQDAGKDYALHCANMKRLNTVVNRGLYIGYKGVHFNEKTALKYKFDKQLPFEFESDNKLRKFKILS